MNCCDRKGNPISMKGFVVVQFSGHSLTGARGEHATKKSSLSARPTPLACTVEMHRKC